MINRASLPTLSLITTEGSNTQADTPGDAPSSERSLRDALTKAEQILAESQELARIGSWEWDIATGRLAWTAQTFRNFGEDPHSFIPSFENYTERLHPDDREMMTQTVQGAILSRKPFDYYHRLIRRDGSVRTLHARGRAIYDRDGKPIRMVGTGQDVTERIALEAERSSLAAAEVATGAPIPPAGDAGIVSVHGLRVAPGAARSIRGADTLRLVRDRHPRGGWQLQPGGGRSLRSSEDRTGEGAGRALSRRPRGADEPEERSRERTAGAVPRDHR